MVFGLLSFSVRKRHTSSLKKIFKTASDRQFLVLTVVLTILGILSVANASAPQAIQIFADPYFFAKQQVIWTLIGLTAMVVARFIPYQYWRKMAFIIFMVNIGLLFLVLIPGFGSRLLGARRWISIGPLTLQPSEFVKLSLAMLIARLVDDKFNPWSILGVVGGTALLIMLQPDLGTTIVVVTIGFAQLFITGIPYRIFLTSGGIGVAATAILILLSDYRRARLITFLESATDPLGTSYHLRQILIALGSGGLFGVGIGQSRQKHLFLPETATDSVFAVIAEEIGFVGATIVVALLVFFVLKAFKIARNAPDRYSQLLASGIAVWIGAQMFLNIASMVALTPLTGIPLPFFSYGGSSLTMMLLGIGILLNISSYEKKGR